ncbi:hypothetical protein BGZ95_000854 [Linnemannia exigua]|uniref:Galactose oxidase n=1 Tax=Linnemannia exigua TaxID=604196 RepID=A0AAD4H361_9FUNG|nr:hypothetical protein BGZ95_000854 [Linnemannia exigua]
MQHTITTASLLFGISLALLLSLYPSATHGQQQFTPATYYGSQSAFVEGKALYIHGGRALYMTEANPPSDQTFFLDLSSNWSTDKPVFRQLPRAYPSEGSTSTLFNNKNTWYLYNAPTQRVVLFDIQKSAWGAPQFYNSSSTELNLAAVTDPINNSVYVVNGWRTNNTQTNPSQTLRYQESTGEISIAGSGAPAGLSHAAVWSTRRNSILVFGGLNQRVHQNAFWEYGPTAEVYVPLTTQGNVPTGRYGHCMVEAYNGAKIIIFGGVTTQGTSSEIYILDVATLTWTQGATGPLSAARVFTACAVTNDMFVAWGGATLANGNYTVVNTPTIVYNLKTNGIGAWQTTYSPLDDGSSSTTTRGPPVGAIIGGSVGALFLMVFVGGLLIHCRKQRRRDDRHSLSRGVGQGSGSSSEDSLKFKHKDDARASYVVHAPVAEVCPMMPTGFESNAYTAVPCAQAATTQAQIYSPIGATPVVDRSLYYANYVPPVLGQTQQIYDPQQLQYYQQQQQQEIYDPTTMTSFPAQQQQQGLPIIYQPPLASQPSYATDSPQYQYLVPLSHNPDSSAGYAMPMGHSPPTASAAPAPSPAVGWTNSPTVTSASATGATDACSEPAVTVGRADEGVLSKEEVTRRNPQGSEGPN